jgi:FAD/FMN-containing dehydrogenase
MNKIVEVENDHVVVEPGIVKAVLDRELRKRGKFLPVDPASSHFCSIGGMISNNSSGIHCLGYGNMIDFLLAVDLVYVDGSRGYASETGCDEKCVSIKKLVTPQANILSRGFPKVSKNSCGYRLDATIQNGRFLPHKLFAAAEGTLGIVTKAKLRILDLPEHRSLSVFGFSDLTQAVSAVTSVLKFSPVALEMMDHTVVSEGRHRHDAGCLLFVEFAGGRQHVQSQAESCRQSLVGVAAQLEHADDQSSLDRIWAARKGALNNIMKLTVGSRKPIGLIEDTVVPPALLSAHVQDLLQEYRQNDLDYVMYGHVGDGNIHTRPIIDLDSVGQISMMEAIAERIFSRVAKSGGTITGEHGDGIARLPYIGMVYPAPILQLFKKVKQVFDPKDLLNPGKKVATG